MHEKEMGVVARIFRMVGVRGPKTKLRNKAKLLAVAFGNPRDIDVYAHRGRNTTA